MKNPTLPTGLFAVLLFVAGLSSRGNAQISAVAGAAIEGRVFEIARSEYLEKARVTIDGTSLETFTDASGRFRLTGVPAREVTLRIFYTGLPAETRTVTLAAGQTVQLDIQLTAPRPASELAESTVKMSAFIVAMSKEMSGAAIAINEQRVAPNLKNVVATDEFGDIAEGNVAEFLKFLTGRGIGLDQVSINNLSRIEVAFAPTPESQGMALAGSVNMVPRSSFERARPLFNFRTYVLLRSNALEWGPTPGPLGSTRKIHPGADFSYVAPVNKRFGFTLSGGYSRQYAGDPMSREFWRGTIDPTTGDAFPHTTPDRPYLATYVVRTGGKEQTRRSVGATVDYQFGRDDRVTVGFQASSFKVLIDRNTLRFDVNRVLPGQFSPTFTHGVAGAGSTRLATAGNLRVNWTYMPTLIWRHDGPVWKGEVGAALSRAGNRQRDMGAGFFTSTTSMCPGLTVAFDDIAYLRPRTITVTDGAAGTPVNVFSLNNYIVTAAGGTFRATDDTQRTAYANLRRDFHGRAPFSLKGGIDVRQGIRDQRGISPSFTYVGRDGRASSVLAGSDDLAAPFLASSVVDAYGFPAFDGVDARKLYQDYLAHPTYFTSNANTIYRSDISLDKRAVELVSSAYLRGDLSLLQRRLKFTGGVRAEQTNIEAEGPLTDPTRNFLRDAQGALVLGLNGRPQTITTDALRTSLLTYLPRAARADKEYLRLFPSLNASYHVRDNLIARVAAYTSIGRPDFNQYAGGITLPDTASPPSTANRIVVNNIGIKPWSARSLVGRIEYYFEGVGQVSVGGFRRDFENFFGATVFRPGPEFFSLYDLDAATYGDYSVATQYNVADTVRTQGMTIDYKQALTFLPAWARGLQVFANGTVQRLLGPAAGNFAGFVPRTANWGFSLSRPRYNLRANWNYIGRQKGDLIEGASIGPATFNWTLQRIYLDFTAEYLFWRRLAVFANVRNATDAPDDLEIGGPSTPPQARFRERIKYGSLWTIGVKGSF